MVKRAIIIVVAALAAVPSAGWAQCSLTTDYRGPAPDVHLVCPPPDEAPGFASDLLRFRARLRADSAVLSPGTEARLGLEADRLEMSRDRSQAEAGLRALDQDLSFSENALPGSYQTLAGPWPVTPTLTLPDIYAPPGSASIPCVWSSDGTGWPYSCP